MRTKVNLSEITDIKNGIDPGTNLRRAGLVVIFQLKNEFENMNFKTKFADDLKAFKIEFPTANKKTFIEDETARLNKLKEYIQQSLPDDYSNFPGYQTVNSYLDFVQEPDQSQEPEPIEIKKFKTTLTDDERSELCNKIITNKGAEEKGTTIIFKYITEIHKPTLMYLFGGDRPDKIIPIKINSQRKVYELLLSISAEPHPYKEKEICVPDFVKSKICPELLRNKHAEEFEKLKI